MAKRKPRFEQLELFPEKRWEIFFELEYASDGKIFEYSIIGRARTEEEAKNLVKEALRPYSNLFNEARGDRIVSITPKPLDD